MRIIDNVPGSLNERSYVDGLYSRRQSRPGNALSDTVEEYITEDNAIRFIDAVT